MNLASGFALRNFSESDVGKDLGPLQDLIGTWVGTGFNTIWRPNRPANGSDNILELNVTNEVLQFTEIPGKIMNRGLFQTDIAMFGLTYLQQISDSNLKEGIHIEPGIWAVVPATDSPQEQQTVVRMASIPHGTTVLAQGVPFTVNGPPVIQAVDITPFSGPNKIPFPNESNLSLASQFRIPSPAQPQNPPLQFPITQAMVTNPNSVLTNAIANQKIIQTTTFNISTVASGPNGPSPALTTADGGGTANTAFLNGNGANNATAGAANAQAAIMTAIFWIETVQNPDGSTFKQLQYTQTVMLNFNGLTWPHVSVATLRLQPRKIVRFASPAFNGVYLRIDGNGISQSNPLGGTVNGQYGAMTWERYNVIALDDGTSAIESVQFPGVFISLNGAGIGPSNTSGNNAQASFGIGNNGKFNIRPQPDGTVAIESVAFPNVFLGLNAPGATQPAGPGVGATVATWGIQANSKFYMS